MPESDTALKIGCPHCGKMMVVGLRLMASGPHPVEGEVPQIVVPTVRPGVSTTLREGGKGSGGPG